MGPIDSLRWFVPELVLVCTLLVVIVVDLVAAGREGGRPSAWPGILAVLGAGGAVAATIGVPTLGLPGLVGASPRWLFGRMLVLDPFSVFFKVLLGLALLAAATMALASREVRRRPNEGEFFTVLLGAGFGTMLMAAAGHLLMAYLALELLSLSAYVLTGLPRHDRRAGEAALKYLIYGGVASGVMLYGMSWIVGLTGAMDYAGIRQGLLQLAPASRGAFFVALVLVLVGFGYKIAAVPFHMWAPDVYTGAPLPVAAFLAVGSKAAGFAILLRFLHGGIGSEGAIAAVPAAELLALAAFVTMTFGNLAALGQTNMKRLLAYSSIAHAGYALLGVVVLGETGLQAVLLYLVVYYVMNLGAFWVVMLVANHSDREDLEAFRGLAWRGGAVPAVALAIFLFSLAGLPPLAGFIGKFYVFAAAMGEGWYWLVVAAVLNSVVSLYYYARVVRTMFLDQPAPGDPPLAFRIADLGAVGALSLLTVYFGVRFGWLLERTMEAGRVFPG